MILGGLFDVCVSLHTTHKLQRKMFRMLQVINHWWKGAHFAQKWMKHCQDWGKDGQPKGRLGNTFLSSRSSSLTCIQKHWKGKWLLKYFLLLFLLFIVPLLFRGKPCMFISSFFNPSFWNKLRKKEWWKHIATSALFCESESKKKMFTAEYCWKLLYFISRQRCCVWCHLLLLMCQPEIYWFRTQSGLFKFWLAITIAMFVNMFCVMSAFLLPLAIHITVDYLLKRQLLQYKMVFCWIPFYSLNNWS